MKNNVQNAGMTQLNAQIQTLLSQCQQQEAIAKQQLESTNVLKREESRLKLQESDYADRLSRSSEEVAVLSSEGRAYTARVSEEMNNATSEISAERAIMLNRHVAHEKIIQKISGANQHHEEAITSLKQEAKTENDNIKMSEMSI